MKKWIKLKKNEDAQALVEFTLIFPILILLVLGMIEFGWLLNGKITLNSAAREGARVGAVLLSSDTERKTKVMNAVVSTADLSGLTIDIEASTVTEEEDSTKAVRNVVVEVKGEMKAIIGLYVSDTVPMSSVARMRRE